MLTQDDLDGFYCTNDYHKHWLGLYYTDGVKFLAEKAGAYWLLDAIASHQKNPKILKSPELQRLQFWKLKVEDGKGVLTCVVDSGYKPVVTQNIEFTDFPLKEVDIWVQNGVIPGVNRPVFVMMLKSEY